MASLKKPRKKATQAGARKTAPPASVKWTAAPPALERLSAEARP
jgi:hypothetical protein